MTDDFINIVKREYDNWREREKARVNRENQKIKEEIEMWNKIHGLLQDEKVSEFAKCIGYQQGNVRDYLTLHDSLNDFLRTYMVKIDWPERILNKDKYPIYCFYGPEMTLYCSGHNRTKREEGDLYWNLQRPGRSFGPTDSKASGTKREKFRNKYANNIIYPPEGEKFSNLDTFYRIQTEFVEEALRTNQEEAKQMMLLKYGRK